MYFIIIAILATVIVSEISASCNVCQQNHAACRNETHYSLCLVGSTIADTNVYPCKPGTVCTSHSSICIPDGDTEYRASCLPTERCGLCDTSKTFACVNTTHLALCHGDATFSTEQYYPCPVWHYCNVGAMNVYGKICISLCETGSEPTCDNLDPISPVQTTPQPAETESTPNVPVTTPDQSISTQAITTEEPNTTTYPTTTTTPTIPTTPTEPTTTTESTTTTATTIPTTVTSPTITTTPTAPSTVATTSTTYASTTTVPTDPSTTTTRSTTTRPAPLSPNEQCAQMNKIGVYAADGDTTCRKYISCESYRNGFVAYEYVCPELTRYFNEKLTRCTNERPAWC